MSLSAESAAPTGGQVRLGLRGKCEKNCAPSVPRYRAFPFAGARLYVKFMCIWLCTSRCSWTARYTPSPCLRNYAGTLALAFRLASRSRCLPILLFLSRHKPPPSALTRRICNEYQLYRNPHCICFSKHSYWCSL